MSSFFLTSLVLFLIWLGIILFSPTTRREQVIMSLVGLIVAPGALMIASGDYRHAESQMSTIGIEDLLFSFAMFGIAAVIYQVLLGKRIERRMGQRRKVQNATRHWSSLTIIIASVWLFAILFLSRVYGIHPIHAAIVGGLFIGIYIIADRHNLLIDALLSGLFMAILIFLVEQIFFVRLFSNAATTFWSTEALSGLTVGGIPIEEIHWAAVVGFTVGPLYEYIRRYQFR